MTLAEVNDNIGKLVMSTDAGYKMIRSVPKAHGPYRLLKVTKGGFAILEGREGFRIRPSLLSLYEKALEYA